LLAETSASSMGVNQVGVYLIWGTCDLPNRGSRGVCQITLLLGDELSDEENEAVEALLVSVKRIQQLPLQPVS
jgi:hypothetical protein